MFKYFRWEFILYIFLSLLSIPIIDLLIKFPWDEETYLQLLQISGETGIRLLILALLISPLKKNFPSNRFWKFMLKNRRAIGVSSFVFITAHLSIYLIYNTELAFIIEDFKLMHFISGWLAFLLLIPVTFTSNNFAIRKLGGKKWKTVQELVYYAIIFAGLHWLLKEDGGVLPALLHFVPLVIIRSYDIYLDIKSVNKTIPD